LVRFSPELASTIALPLRTASVIRWPPSKTQQCASKFRLFRAMIAHSRQDLLPHRTRDMSTNPGGSPTTSGGSAVCSPQNVLELQYMSDLHIEFRLGEPMLEIPQGMVCLRAHAAEKMESAPAAHIGSVLASLSDVLRE
jgi:hypothetical protein